MIVFPALFLFLAGIGVHSIYEPLVALPHRYDALRDRGVRVDAVLVRCARGIGGGRGLGCRLRLDFRGQARTWNYPENSHQFGQFRPGDKVPVLVDRSDPGNAYTVRDVQARTNTGVGPLLLFGVAMTVVGLAGLTWFVRFALSRRRR